MKNYLNQERKKRVVLGSSDVNINTNKIKLPEKFSKSSNLRDIKISVDKNQWKQVDTLRKSTPSDRHYVIRREENGEVYIQFGDGVNGARPPSGENNVTATYRSGAGAEGNTPTKRKKRVKKARIN